MGGIGPHLGEIWGSEYFIFGHISHHVLHNPLLSTDTVCPNITKLLHNVEPIDLHHHAKSRDRAISGFAARWRQTFFFDPQFLGNGWAWHEITGTLV